MRKRIIDFIDLNKMDVIDANLERVNVIASNNDKYVEIARKLEYIFDNLEEINVRIKKLFNDFDMFAVMQEKVIVFTKLQKKIAEFNEYEQEYNFIAMQVTQQDEFIRNEFAFFQKNMRKVLDVYTDKRILLDRIAPQIDQYKKQIKDVEKDFQKIIDAMNIDKADSALRKYSRMVIKFTKIINEGPSLSVQLYNRIPKTVKELQSLYTQRKEELQGPMEHVNFKNSIVRIAGDYEKAKAAFNKLDFLVSSDFIRKIFKSFKSLEKMINFEIESRNLFVNIYKSVIKEIKRSLEHYLLLKKQFIDLVGAGKKMGQEIFEKYNNLKITSKNIDKMGIEYRQLMLNKMIPYSLKISRSETILKTTVGFIDDINDFMQLLWVINLDISMIKNKFKRAEGAIHEIITNIKSENIKLSTKEMQEFDKLLAMKTEIFENLEAGKITKNSRSQVEKFSEQTIHFYSAISGNAQMAFHIQNMLRELAPKRASDEKLNFNLQIAERDFFDGKYASALNQIIETVKGGL